MSNPEILYVLAGALAAGFVSGLTGMGTGITAMGLWLHALSPPVAASLVVVCSLVAQLQTLPMIWRSIEWRAVLPFVVPGLVGVPIGTSLLALADAATFSLGVGVFLVLYAGYALLRRQPRGTAWGGRIADGAVGFGGGMLGGLAGFSGVLPIVWADVRGLTKEPRRYLLQAFNTSILVVALAAHAQAGLLTPELGAAALAALPGTIAGAWLGTFAYRRIGESRLRQIILALLLVAGVVLIGRNF